MNKRTAVLFASFLPLSLSLSLSLSASQSANAAIIPSQWNYGPVLTLQPNTKNPLPAKLSFMQWNVENHFATKPVPSLKAVAQMYLKTQPDLILNQEVDTLQTMHQFDDQYLNDSYEELLIDGNDGRGIDSGMYISKKLAFEVELRSFKTLADQDGPIFRRDAATFIFREPKTHLPLFIVIGVHLKSMRPMVGDPTGSIQREREVGGLIQVKAILEKEFGIQIPLLISGDLNNDALTAPEFQGLRTNLFVDALQFLSYTGKRYTHFFFAGQNRQDFKQLDSTQLNTAAQNLHFVTSGEILQQLDPNGKTLPDPKSIKEKEAPYRPSDHKPTLFSFDLSHLVH